MRDAVIRFSVFVVTVSGVSIWLVQTLCSQTLCAGG